MIIECYYTPKFVEVTKEKTERGEGGFGSTGLWFFFLSFWKKFRRENGGNLS